MIPFYEPLSLNPPLLRWNLNTSQTKEQKRRSDWCEMHTLMRRSDWCEIHTINDLTGASNILLSVRYHRWIFFTRAFRGKRQSWNSGLIFFSFGRKSQSSPHHACVTSWVWRMRDVLTNEQMSTQDRTKRSFRGAKSAQTLCVRRSKRIQNMLTSFAVDPH